MKAAVRSLVATFLLVIMSTGSMYASCGPDNCVGPCTYEEIIWDTTFLGNCPQWVWSGSAHRVQVGSNWLAELYGNGNFSQTVTTYTYTHMDMAFDLSIVKTNPGTEKLYVEIIRNTTIAETVAVIYPSATQTDYSFPIDNYSNEMINLRFRYKPGTAPGDTVFRIDNVVMFGYSH